MKGQEGGHGNTFLIKKKNVNFFQICKKMNTMGGKKSYSNLIISAG